MLTELMDLILKRQKQQAIFSTLPGVMIEGVGRRRVEVAVSEEKVDMRKAPEIEASEVESDTGDSRLFQPMEEQPGRDTPEDEVDRDNGNGCTPGIDIKLGFESDGGRKHSLGGTFGEDGKGVPREVRARKASDRQEESGRSDTIGRGGHTQPVPRRQAFADPFAEIDFQDISPGVFLMGSSEEEQSRHDDEMPHEVTLTSGFSIQATLVTRRQWKMLMGGNPSSFPVGGLECPVDGVSWNDCQEFIQRLNAAGTYRYRLPTEAEWEYACRAGTSAAFGHEGIDLAEHGHCAGLDEIAWYHGNSQAKPHPVALKKPNAWGLYDMHGNLCEWCQDWYGAYPRESRKDPSGSLNGFKRVSRGGCWASTAQNCRCACRFSWEPDWRSDFVGFRLVREAI